MPKLLIINVIVLALFFILVKNNNFINFTDLGLILLFVIYIIVNLIIYFLIDRKKS